MTPGNLEFVQVMVSMTVETGGVAAFLYADGRLRPMRRRPRRWLPATGEAAVLGAFLFGALYGVPALIIHFVKSRGAVGLALGLLCAVTVVSVDIGAELGAAAAIDWLGL